VAVAGSAAEADGIGRRSNGSTASTAGKGGGEHGGRVERARDAAPGGGRVVGGLLGGDPSRGEHERDRAAEHDDARARVLAACQANKLAFLEMVTPENVIEQIGAGVMIGAGRHAGPAAEIGRRLPITLELTVLSMLIALCIAIPAGALAAVHHDKSADRTISVVSIVALSVPAFWTGTLLIVLPARWWGYSPPFGYSSLLANPAANLRQMLPAAITLGAIFTGIITRFVRSSLLEVLRQDYIRTAWAKGLRELTVLLGHALRNAFLPVITVVGLQIGALLGGAIITESVFNIPGMGTLTISAINQRDYPQLEANVLVLAFIVVVVNLLVDVIYGWIDPRIHVQ